MVPATFLALALCLALPRPAAGARAARRPNVVVVFVDDMGWGDLSSFGNQDVKTINIDRLADEGIRFEQFYVNAPICSPSRTAISTGQYPQRWRINSFLSDRAHNEKRGMAQWLDPDAPMLARFLQSAGYATGHFGKWHMGGQRDVGEAPLITDYGFDSSLTNFEGLGNRLLPLLDAHDGKEPRPYALGSDKLGRGDITWMKRDLVTEGFVLGALDFIAAARTRDKPFYVNLWPDDVHTPLFPPQALRSDGSKRALYLGVLKTMDQQLGLLFDHIRQDETLRDNTLVLVASDNGPERGAGDAGPFRGRKADLHEGGIRSPLIVWGPGLLPRHTWGTVNKHAFLAAFDLVPSLLAITGTRVSPKVAFDGESLPQVLLGRSRATRRGPVFFRQPADNWDEIPDLAVRHGKWKLLCEDDGTKPELYDLDADRGEVANVAARHPGVVRRLMAQLLAWNRSMPRLPASR